MDSFQHSTWNFPRGFYNLSVGVAVPEVLRQGGGGAHLPDNQVRHLASFAVANTSLQILVDASIASSGRAPRPQHSEFYDIVAALEADTVNLSPNGRRGSRLGISGSSFVADRGLSGGMQVIAGMPGFGAPAPDPLYNNTLRRYQAMYPDLTMNPTFSDNVTRRFACVGESQYPMCAFADGMDGAHASCTAFLNSSLNQLIAEGAASNPELLVTVMDGGQDRLQATSFTGRRCSHRWCCVCRARDEDGRRICL